MKDTEDTDDMKRQIKDEYDRKHIMKDWGIRKDRNQHKRPFTALTRNSEYHPQATYTVKTAVLFQHLVLWNKFTQSGQNISLSVELTV